jgi:hypothetical protein
VVFVITYAEIIIADNNLLMIEAAMELQVALSLMWWCQWKQQLSANLILGRRLSFGVDYGCQLPLYQYMSRCSYHSEAASLVRSSCPEATSSVEQMKYWYLRRRHSDNQMAEHSGANTDLAMNGTSTWQEDGYWCQLWLHDVRYHLCRDHHGELQLDGD